MVPVELLIDSGASVHVMNFATPIKALDNQDAALFQECDGTQLRSRGTAVYAALIPTDSGVDQELSFNAHYAPDLVFDYDSDADDTEDDDCSIVSY